MSALALRRAATAAATLVLLSSACGDEPTVRDRLTDDLEAARAAWAAASVTSYTFVAFRSCECLPDWVGPVRVTVDAGAVSSVVRVDNGNVIDVARWFTIDDLFALIDDQIRVLPSRVEATYDAARGHPVRVAYGEREVDAGAVIDISEFAPRVSAR